MKSSIRFGSALLGMTLASALHADTLVQYKFPTNTKGQPATSADTNVVAGSFVWGAGITPDWTSSSVGFDGGTDRSIFVTSAQVNEAISDSSGDYVGFTISAAEGYQLDLSALSFYFAHTNTNGTISSSATFDVRSSLDYTTSIWSQSVNVVNNTSPTWSLADIDLTDSAYQDLESISFRIYLNDGENTSGNSQLRFDSVTLSGASTAIPEPSTYALLGGVGVLGLAVLRRRRQAA